MPEFEQISWKVMVGNRFTKTLAPAMGSEAGYIKTSTVRRIGDDTKSTFLVKYDRDYLIAYIARLICKPLFVYGKDKVLALVDEAWDYIYGASDTTSVRKEVS